MGLLIASELLTLRFAMHTLSAVRAFVGGEGLWSKAQKSAVSNLQKYILTGDESFYGAYLESLRVPLGDRRARLELEKPVPDRRVIYEGFVEGRISGDDVPALIDLFRRFNRVSYLKEAIEIWREGDRTFDELMAFGNEWRAARNHPMVRERTLAALDKLADIDRRLTVLEDTFSYTLGDGSRHLERVLMFGLILAVLGIEGTGLFLTFRFTRNLTTSLQEMNVVAKSIGEGNFSARVSVRSNDELGELAQAINKMAANIEENIGVRMRAESASQSKSIFLANMSHEIRSPLGAILGYTELLKEQGVTEEDKAEYLEIIHRTGHNLTQIINDILDLSKVEAGKLEIASQEVRLNDLLMELEKTYAVRAEEGRVALSFEKSAELPPHVRLDPVRLKQILINLLNNAMKFARGRTVHVRAETDSSELRFTVTDTGIGMTTETVANLFQVFSQGDSSTTRTHHGTGLGLALSRRLARAMGGDLVLVSTAPGRGTSFRLDLPLEIATRVDRPQAQRTGGDHSLNHLRILVVDDSADNQLLLKKILSRQGALVDIAGDGAEGVKKALQKNVDLILMDMQMPVKDGYAATRELREHGFRAPIIAVTAHAMKDDREKCMEAGCSDYVTKPIHFQELIQVVERHTTSATA
jgi:signal transduction histidine kinase